VTRAFTHCQRGCTLLSMASMASGPAIKQRHAYRTAPTFPQLQLFYSVWYGWLAGWLAGWQGCAVVDRVWVGLLLKQ